MFEKLLTNVASNLKKGSLPYMIIGGQAVLLYGTPRMTKDIDITLGVSIDELERVITAIDEIGLKVIPEDFESFVKKTFVLPTKDEESGIRVDFIFSYTPYERQAIKRAKPISLKKMFAMFASVEDVIIHKIFAGRPRDLEDVRSIVIKNPDVDRNYIRKWLKEFDKASEKKGFLKTFEEIVG